MDEFAQSRGEDDLFDDEILPIEDLTSTEDLNSQLQDVSLDTGPPPTESPIVQTRELRGSSTGWNRGTAGVRRETKKGGLLNSRYATQPQEEHPATQVEPNPVSRPEDVDSEIESKVPEAQSNVPEAPSASSKPPAVRGDRTATGGLKKPKLTEEELNAKLAAAKERSQNLSAAHARAQADAASFEERERIAQERRLKDATHRRAMDREREKNRARKMAVMGGREWDAEKNEDDFRIPHGRGGGRSNVMRAMNGTTSYDRRDPALDDISQYEWHEGRGRGRGRGRGSGRGGTRAGRSPTPQSSSGHTQRLDVDTDVNFPALPSSSSKTPDPPKPTPARTQSNVKSPADEKRSWAEQVEMNEAATS